VLLGGILGGLIYGWARLGPIDLAELEQRYRLPNSQFMDIDGIRVHYVEDGPKDAPCLVLVHGAFMNLRIWDAFVGTLPPTRHVVRMDLLASGLTGPDPKKTYSVARDVQIVSELTRKLGIEKFDLLGTSTGGTVAYQLAAAEPQRVARLILIDADGLPGVADRVPESSGWLGDWVRARITFRSYWTDMLYDEAGVIPPTKPFVEMVFEMNRRAGLRAETALRDASPAPEEARDVLPRVTAPTLLLWGTSDPTTPHLDAEVFAYWLRSAPSLIKKYPHIGHYPYVETPGDVARDVLAFIGGARDSELRRTERVPIPASAGSP
jgi:pimeloyl-ACP methyl ester carboxylesterase